MVLANLDSSKGFCFEWRSHASYSSSCLSWSSVDDPHSVHLHMLCEEEERQDPQTGAD